MRLQSRGITAVAARWSMRWKHLTSDFSWRRASVTMENPYWLQVAAVPFCWEVFSVTPQGRSPFYSNFAGTSAPVHKVSDPNTAAKSRSELYPSTPQAGKSPCGQFHGRAPAH